MAIVSTRNINIVLAKKKRLERVTTKDIDASIKINKPKEESKMKKSPLISTHNIQDVESASEKKERDDVVAERKKLKKGDPVHLDADGNLVASEKEQKHVEEHMKNIDGKVFKTTEDMNLDMRDDKKIAMAERMKKVRAGKEKKKDEK